MAELIVGLAAGALGVILGAAISGTRSRKLRREFERLSHALEQSSRRNRRLMEQNEKLMLLLNQAIEGERIDVIRGPDGEVKSFVSSTESVAAAVDSHRRPAGRSPRRDANRGKDERNSGH